MVEGGVRERVKKRKISISDKKYYQGVWARSEKQREMVWEIKRVKEKMADW